MEQYKLKYTGQQIDDLLDKVPPFVVTFTMQDGTWVADTPFADIQEAIANGQNVIGKYSNRIYRLNDYGSYSVDFCRSEVDDEGLSVVQLSVINDNTVERTAQYTQALITDAIELAINNVLNTEA